MNFEYESHIHKDPAFPIIYNLQQIDKNYPSVNVNWHESVEIIYVVKGSCTCFSNAKKIPATKGDVVIINSYHLHTVSTKCDCQYYYLIVDKGFCDSFGFSVTDTIFQSHIQDPYFAERFRNIEREWHDNSEYFKAAIKAEIISIYVYLFRNYAIGRTIAGNNVDTNQISSMVKDAIVFISNNFDKPITLELLCSKIGYSTCYFCRVFKEMTDHTVIDYINILRCNKAQLLLSSGNNNVAECANLCGFCSPSYFTKQYKKHMGALPSKHIKKCT